MEALVSSMRNMSPRYKNSDTRHETTDKGFTPQHFNAGFTIIETLLSVALLALVAAIGTPILFSFQSRSDLDTVRDTVVQNLRRAQLLSQATSDDGPWGVYATTSVVTVFQGSSFAMRNALLDEENALPTPFRFSGLSEVVYSKTYGLPQTSGTLTLMNSENATRTISINAKGTLIY